MILRTDKPKAEVAHLLAGVSEVDAVEEIKGGTLVIAALSPDMEIAAARSRIEARLGQTMWVD